MTREEELTSLRQRLAKSQGMEGYGDRRKALQARIDELERNAPANN